MQKQEIKYDNLKSQLPRLNSQVKWFNSFLNPEQTNSKDGKWFYDIRDIDNEFQILKVYDAGLLHKFKQNNNGEILNPITHKSMNYDNLRKFSIGSGGTQKKYHIHNNRKYLVHYGPRGGKYIIVLGKKKSVS